MIIMIAKVSKSTMNNQSMFSYIISILTIVYFIYTCIDKLSWTHIDSPLSDLI